MTADDKRQAIDGLVSRMLALIARLPPSERLAAAAECKAIVEDALITGAVIERDAALSQNSWPMN